jgi:ribA/ribD-fused uncharacterized protein
MCTYNRSESVVFFKTKEEFGGLSNMAGGYPLRVNGVHIPTSEALYQACRFPHRPDIQREIIAQQSPIAAKMKSKKYRHDSRSDWEKVRVDIMRWCLRVKLVQNWEKFSALLLETRDLQIVELSRKDDFWGAKLVDDQTLVGRNVLGHLLMELREEVRRDGRAAFHRVEPLLIDNFLLLDKPICPVIAENSHEKGAASCGSEEASHLGTDPSCESDRLQSQAKPENIDANRPVQTSIMLDSLKQEEGAASCSSEEAPHLGTDSSCEPDRLQSQAKPGNIDANRPVQTSMFSEPIRKTRRQAGRSRQRRSGGSSDAARTSMAPAPGEID